MDGGGYTKLAVECCFRPVAVLGERPVWGSLHAVGDPDIILIDANSENKPSASKAKT
jgi:hypothetical protein